ncbi:MAG TPA: carboxyl transferase domain-containing protein [Candidatus Obscuribacterales bacterium]
MSQHPEFDKYRQLLRQQAAEEATLKLPEGQLSARQRLKLLYDQGEYRELFRFARAPEARNWQDGIVCAHGLVHGRPVAAYATEVQVQGGSQGMLQTRQIAELYRLARNSGIPMVAMLQSGGARISEAFHISEGFVPPMREAIAASSVIPQIACAFGHCIGAAALMATLGDFIVMEASATMSIAGARVNRSATGENLSEEQLGGVEIHTRDTGNVHFVCQGEAATLARARELLRWLPSNQAEPPPRFESHDPAERAVPSLLDLIPNDDTTPFDIRALIRAIADDGRFFEVQAEFAPNLVTGFASFGGETMAIVANQSLHLAGALDPAAARKCSRFLNWITNFNYPLLSLVDVPGAMPTLAAQQQGMLIHAAQVLQSLYQVRGLKVSIVVRRCFGGTYGMLNPKSGEGDLVYAYPNAMIGVMNDAAMTTVLSQSEQGKAQVEKLHAAGLRLDDPLLGAANLYLDDIIDPADTRRVIIGALRSFGTKRITHYPPKLFPNFPI